MTTRLLVRQLKKANAELGLMRAEWATRPKKRRIAYRILKTSKAKQPDYEQIVSNRYGAMKKKRGTDMALGEYKELIQKPCHYCGGRFGDPSTIKNGAGLDRIDNTKGYEKSNVIPCCHKCNVTRGYLYSVKDAKIMIQAVLKERD